MNFAAMATVVNEAIAKFEAEADPDYHIDEDEKPGRFWNVYFDKLRKNSPASYKAFFEFFDIKEKEILGKVMDRFVPASSRE